MKRWHRVAAGVCLSLMVTAGPALAAEQRPAPVVSAPTAAEKPEAPAPAEPVMVPIYKQAATVPTGLKVNGQLLHLDQGPAVVDGVLMIPLRAVAEAAGAQVDWDQPSHTASVRLSRLVATIPIGQTEAEARLVGVFYIRRPMVTMQHAPVLMGNRTLISADALSGVLGLTVNQAVDGTMELTLPAPAN